MSPTHANTAHRIRKGVLMCSRAPQLARSAPAEIPHRPAPAYALTPAGIGP